jgi:hypothetical protein
LERFQKAMLEWFGLLRLTEARSGARVCDPQQDRFMESAAGKAGDDVRTDQGMIKGASFYKPVCSRMFAAKAPGN